MLSKCITAKSGAGLDGAITNYLQALTDPHSLTKRLKALAQKKFEVEVLSEGWQFVAKSVANVLNCSISEYAWQRKVILKVDGEIFVNATSYIPLKTLRNQGRCLLFLGKRPLGELLFQDKGLQRSPFIWSDALWHDGKLTRLTRSSLFYFYHQPLLVSETFTEKALLMFTASSQQVVR
jgi:chorismate-pyruvate lyase